MLVMRIREYDDIGCSKCCDQCVRFIKAVNALGIVLKVKYVDDEGKIAEFGENTKPNPYKPKNFYW